MFKSHILKYRVGIISMLVVMVCMIICSVLFDSSGEVGAESSAEETEIATPEITGDVDWGTEAPIVLGNPAGEVEAIAVIITPEPTPTPVTEPEDEDPYVISEGDLQGQIMEELLENYEVTMYGDDDEEVVLDINEVEFLPIYNRGTRDSSVAVIQSKLMDLGFMEPAEPTNYYGSITMEAVKRFQRQNDLKQDGIMGQETIAMILDPTAKSYLLKKGMEGDDIKLVQTRLYELGYLEKKSLINGTFRTETENAVRALQNANGLTADGLVGTATTELLYY
ncbi:MAG: peptidoglycan-binding protein, partial [Lachnospiraceae bacterium]|nr:peptidoglycan-binding protein [Lachnospiraceae bacterium]